MQTTLGQRTAQGFAWVVLQTFGVKAVNVIGQILLAYLLMPQDFGIISLAYSGVAFISGLQQGGIRDILLQRGTKIGRWVNTGFWLSVCLGSFGVIFLALAAPFIARAYKAPELTGMIWILSLALFYNNLSIIPRALLESRFEFKSLAIITAAMDSMQMILTVLLVFLGLGAYSFVWSALWVYCLRTYLLWRKASPVIHLRRPFRNWQLIVKNMLILMMATVALVLTQQGDYMVLGITTSPAQVGIYYLAFTLAQQMILMIVVNISPILLSSLGHLQKNGVRQFDVALRMSRLMTFMVVPLCLLQALLAPSFLAAFYEPRWAEASAAGAILSLGMIGRVVDPVSENLIKAKGRFALIFWINVAQAASLIGLLFLVAPSHNWILISSTVAFVLMFWGAFRFGYALRLSAGNSLSLLSIYGWPIFTGCVALGIVWLLRLTFAPASTRWHYILEILLVSLSGIALYLLLSTRLMPSTWRDAMRGLQHLQISKKFERFHSRAVN